MRRVDVAPLLKTVLDKIQPSTIKNSFRVTGLSPFNPDAVDYSKCIEVVSENNDLVPVPQEPNAQARPTPSFPVEYYQQTKSVMEQLLPAKMYLKAFMREVNKQFSRSFELM